MGGGAKRACVEGLGLLCASGLVCGPASLCDPPLRVSSCRVRPLLAISGGGGALMVLPTWIVGNDLLMLGVVALAVGGWFIAHRHGQLRGLIEANKNGKPGEV